MDGLTGSIEQAQRNKPKIKLPRPAGDPALERALMILQKYFPQEIQRANIQPMSWKSSLAEPDIFGTSDQDKNVLMNRIRLTIGSDPNIQRTLAHELTHVGQSPQSENEFMMQYDRRPSEIAAFNNAFRIMQLLDEQRKYTPEYKQSIMPQSNIQRGFPGKLGFLGW